MGGLGNKEIMSKNIKYYMALNGKDRKDLCEDLGFKYTTFVDWVNGVTYPRIDKIEMMANYFGIEKSDLIEERKEKTARTPNQLLVTVADDSIFHGKPEKLQGHVDNLDTMEPALAEKLLQKIASSAELFPRSRKKPPDINITIIDEKIDGDSFRRISPEKITAKKSLVKKAMSVAVEPERSAALLQQLGRSSRIGVNELQNRLGMLSQDDYEYMMKLFGTILAESPSDSDNQKK